MNEYFQYIIEQFFYNIIDAIALGISLVIFIKIITWLTPLKELRKIQENSIGAAIVWAIIFIIFAAFIISGYFIPEVSQ